MSLNITGLDQAPSIPIGATITRAYWTLPDHYTPGTEYDSEAAAIRGGLTRAEEQARRHTEHYGTPQPEHGFSVDLRWEVTWPSTGKGITALVPSTSPQRLDTVARRVRYASTDEAREHLARIVQFHRHDASCHPGNCEIEHHAEFGIPDGVDAS